MDISRCKNTLKAAREAAEEHDRLTIPGWRVCDGRFCDTVGVCLLLPCALYLQTKASGAHAMSPAEAWAWAKALGAFLPPMLGFILLSNRSAWKKTARWTARQIREGKGPANAARPARMREEEWLEKDRAIQRRLASAHEALALAKAANKGLKRGKKSNRNGARGMDPAIPDRQAAPAPARSASRPKAKRL